MALPGLYWQWFCSVFYLCLWWVACDLVKVCSPKLNRIQTSLKRFLYEILTDGLPFDQLPSKEFWANWKWTIAEIKMPKIKVILLKVLRLPENKSIENDRNVANLL